MPRFKVNYKGSPFDDTKLPKSDWEFEWAEGAEIFFLVEAAIEMGVRPSEVGICFPEQDLLLVAFHKRRKNAMASWDAEMQKKENK